MREDFMETLDKMFPKGYVILYTNPDGNLRMALFNPQRYELIERYHQLIEENKNGLFEP